MARVARKAVTGAAPAGNRQDTEGRFRLLFDSNLVAIAFWDSQDFITEANDAYLALIGYTRAEFEPGKISWRDLTPPEYRDLDDHALQEAHAHSVSKTYEKEYLRRDGHRTPVEIGVAEIRSSPGAKLAFALDISERKRMQAHLLRSQKLESMSILAGGIAHDFNNLLMGIIANASLIQDEVTPGSPLAELSENVLVATEQAAHLTRQMLAYSGRGKFAIESVDLSAKVEEVTSLITASIPKRIAVRLNLGHNVPCTHADPIQVEQVIVSLVMNGAEAIPGEGVVTVSVSAREIGSHDRLGNLAGAPLPPGRYIVLEVHDTGTGMSEETLAKIFDPFFSTKFTGRGLGLAAVAGIMRGHHGGITVSSKLGGGSTFQVLFPAQKEAAGASSSKAR